MSLNVFRQDNGSVVSKLPHFEPGKGAVEKLGRGLPRPSRRREHLRLLLIKGCFNEGEFDDSVSRIVERAALGKGNYDGKVLNNIWGMFTNKVCRWTT